MLLRCRYEGGEEAADGSGDKGQAGALMAQIRDQLFTTGAFARLIKKVGVEVAWEMPASWRSQYYCLH